MLLGVVPEVHIHSFGLKRFDQCLAREAHFLEVDEQHVAVVIDALLVGAAVWLGQTVQLGETIVHQADVLVHELIQGVEAFELLAG